MIDLIVSAVIPPLLVAFFIYRNDIYEIEPHKLLLSTFFIGFVIIIPMIILELISTEIIQNLLLYSIIGIALVEEGLKYLILIFYNYPMDDFNEPYDGIIYSVMLTMGFALVENIMYVVGDGGDSSVALTRMVLTIPMHATCGVVMGYFLGKAKMEIDNKNQKLILAILLPTLIHGLYNYFLFIELPGLSILIVIFGVIYALKAIKIHQKNSPFKQ
jgi:protease PrsW